MTRKSFEEWAEIRPGHDGYARSIVSRKNVVFDTMILLPDGEAYLGPLFKGGFGLVTVTDNRNYPRLQVETVAFAEWIDKEARSVSTIGRDVLKAAEMNTSRDYLMGRYRNKTYEPVAFDDTDDSFRFNVADVMPGSATLDHPHLHRQTVADAELGGVEMVSLFAALVEKVPTERLLPMMQAWRARIEERARRMLEFGMPADVTVERPYRLIFQGTDDFSYGRTFRSVAEAEAVVDRIATSPTAETVQKLLVFTN
jgi:hypothetical protein